MSTFAIHDADGALVSIGTIVADPLPDGLTALELIGEQLTRQQAGWGWTPSTLSFDVEPPAPEPTEAERLADVEAFIEALAGE